MTTPYASGRSVGRGRVGRFGRGIRARVGRQRRRQRRLDLGGPRVQFLEPRAVASELHRGQNRDLVDRRGNDAGGGAGGGRVAGVHGRADRRQVVGGGRQVLWVGTYERHEIPPGSCRNGSATTRLCVACFLSVYCLVSWSIFIGLL